MSSHAVHALGTQPPWHTPFSHRAVWFSWVQNMHSISHISWVSCVPAHCHIAHSFMIFMPLSAFLGLTAFSTAFCIRHRVHNRSRPRILFRQTYKGWRDVSSGEHGLEESRDDKLGQVFAPKTGETCAETWICQGTTTHNDGYVFGG